MCLIPQKAKINKAPSRRERSVEEMLHEIAFVLRMKRLERRRQGCRRTCPRRAESDRDASAAKSRTVWSREGFSAATDAHRLYRQAKRTSELDCAATSGAESAGDGSFRIQMHMVPALNCGLGESHGLKHARLVGAQHRVAV